MYLSNTTEPDISYSVSYHSQIMQKPTKQAWKAAKGVLQYLKGAQNMGIRYKKQGFETITAFSDSDWDKRDRIESQLEYIFFYFPELISLGNVRSNRLLLKVLLKHITLHWRILSGRLNGSRIWTSVYRTPYSKLKLGKTTKAVLRCLKIVLSTVGPSTLTYNVKWSWTLYEKVRSVLFSPRLGKWQRLWSVFPRTWKKYWQICWTISLVISCTGSAT